MHRHLFGLMILPQHFILSIGYLPQSCLAHHLLSFSIAQPQNYGNFKPFGCWVFPFLRDYTDNKLSPRSRPCIFLGYSSSYKGLWCLDLDFSQVFLTHHAQFDELLFLFSRAPSSSKIQDLEITSFLEASGVSSGSLSP